MSTVVASARYRLAMRISARHGATNEPVPVAAAMHPQPFGWFLRTRGGEVLVVARQDAPPPAAPPSVELRAVGTRWLGMLAAPSASVVLGAAQLTHRFDPIAMELVVDLVRPADGGPRTGAAVTVRATKGPAPRPAVALAETEPGRYSSGSIAWTAEFTPFDVLVDGTQLTTSAMDFTRPGTRIRLIDTT